MGTPQLDRQVRHRLAVLRHVEDVTGNIAMTCRYFGITRPTYCNWLRGSEAEYLKRYHDVTISNSGVWRILRRVMSTPNTGESGTMRWE